MKKSLTMNSNLLSELVRQLSHFLETGDIAGGLRLARKASTDVTERHEALAGEFRCLEAKLQYASGDYRKSLASARIATALLAPYGETEQLAEAFLLTGKALINIGNYNDAETAFLDAESLYRRNENDGGRIDAVNQLARVSFIRGEYKNALKYLLEAVQLADGADDQRTLAYLWGNLGRVYTFLGNFVKAGESLELNISISAELGDDREKAKALLSLGYLEMQSELFEKAQKRFDEAYLILIREKMNREMVMCQTYMGELKLRCDEHVAARRNLNEAIDGARALAPNSSLLVSPLRLLAELELACDNLTAAAQLANSVLAQAEAIGETVEKGAALRVLARIELKKAQDVKPDPAQTKARDLFAQALECFSDAEAGFEKADTLVIMALSGLGSARRRLANLFRAADLFKRLGVPTKHEKTQQLINRMEVATLDDQPSAREESPEDSPIITTNRRMKTILGQLQQAAQVEIPVLLYGDTGTGKDLMARYYHSQSGRPGHFVAANCAAFPDTLLEAELFGYRKGAFTGAGADKEGLLHRANGGTFFLDEIGEMSLVSQAKLLSVIETCRARRLGDTSEEHLDIRFIAATNRNLLDMVEAGTFRRDLYYRLSGISFHIPSLSERPEDIPLLLQHFLRREGGIGESESLEPALIAEFTSRAWPGNVRQLESEVKKLMLFSTMAREDSLGDLAGVLVQNDGDAETASLVNQVEQFEKALIVKALRQAQGNKSQAARALAIHESTLRAKMKRYALSPAAIS